ncbi:uncharacterized protein LAJ45_11226 [Morchella importuna]|uniref:uncharacterized protein n=1 Tax=Morchella importuna TaxID=1174673 RepID=UPI001E8E9482|nr:uncharacterized protein LAJ45_11226 [Morchella importuna]KAH8144725.1 hypothetical protein LAJ45_11226 [Morchella importuna]
MAYSQIDGPPTNIPFAGARPSPTPKSSHEYSWKDGQCNWDLAYPGIFEIGPVRSWIDSAPSALNGV